MSAGDRSGALGRQLAIAGGVLFGANGVQTEWFRSAGGTTPELMALRYVGGALLFAAVLVAVGTRRPDRRDVLGASLVGVLQVAFSTCLLFGFQVSSVALTVLLFYTYPLIVAVAASVLYDEPLTPRRIVLVVIGTCGVVLAVGTPTDITLEGVLLGLGAGVGNAGVALGTRALLSRGMGVEQVTGLGWILPGVCFALLWLTGAIPLPPPNLEAWGAGIFYVVLGAVVPILLWYGAIKRIGASLASLLATVEPVVGVLLAWALIGESLAAGQIVGGALIIGAVAALSLEPREAPVAAPG